MPDEEKAEESYIKYRDEKCEITRNTYNHLHKDWRKSGVDRHKAYIDGYLYGLAEGRKEKWHDLRKNPNDLPKCTENEQIIFYVKDYYESIKKYINHYCLGFYKKSFMNDDVKLFVERSKGYECEHLPKNVFWWCELPQFKE